MSAKQYPRILIVEDDPDQQWFIREALCEHYEDPEGSNITMVSTGAQCLELDLSDFDIVLQDYHLPDMTGLDLLDRVLQQVDIPVIFVTGENSSSTAAAAIQRGAQDYMIKMGDYLFALPVMVDKNVRQHQMKLENRRLERELQAMVGQLRDKNDQLHESMQKLETMASTDAVTGLANRRRFAEALDRYYSEAVRYGFDLTCCMCDLDYYKEFNDTFGHQAGDEVLVATADIIRSSLRSSDIAARYGGDEFVLLLPHTAMARAVSVGRRVQRELLAVGGRYGQSEHSLCLSAGIASLNVDHPTTAHKLVAMADRALYVAKERGRNQVVLYSAVAGQAGASVA